MKGLSHSRPTEDLEPLDLTDPFKTVKVFADFAPDWVIHCAAERRPDVAEKVREISDGDPCPMLDHHHDRQWDFSLTHRDSRLLMNTFLHVWLFGF